MLPSGHDIEIHRHLPLREHGFHRQIARKAVRLMVFQGMAKRPPRIQRHLAAFQQRNHPVNARKRGEFAVTGDGGDAGPPGKIPRRGRETANLTRLARAVTPETDGYFTDIKEFHDHS